MATYLIPGVGLVEGSGQTLLIPGAGLVEFPSEGTTTSPVRQGIQYPSGVIVHGSWTHKIIGLGGN